MKIRLKNTIKITKILRKSYAKAFKDIQIGDILILQVDVKVLTSRSSHNSVYSSYIDVTNLRTKKTETISMSNCATILPSNYEFEELKPIKPIEQVQAEYDNYEVMTVDYFCEHEIFYPDEGKGYFHDGNEITNISVWQEDLEYDDIKDYPYICWQSKRGE